MENAYMLENYNSSMEEQNNLNQAKFKNEESSQDQVSKVKKLIPSNDSDLIGLAKRVLEEWKNHPELVLLWTDVNKFEEKINDFEKAAKGKHTKISNRSPLVKSLRDLDKEIDKNLIYVKQYISIKFGRENAYTYYPEFGIEKDLKNRYMLALDREERVIALEKLIDAMTKYQMNYENYGLDYWKDVYQRYISHKNQVSKLTQNSSMDIKDLRRLRSEINEILRALSQLIKIQYPNDYKDYLNKFGFIKIYN